jgi:hypothetical protein
MHWSCLPWRVALSLPAALEVCTDYATPALFLPLLCAPPVCPLKTPSSSGAGGITCGITRGLPVRLGQCQRWVEPFTYSGLDPALSGH